MSDKETRNLLILALVEICYMHSAEVVEQVKSAEGESIIEEGMKLLGLKDLSEEEVARVRAATPQVTPQPSERCSDCPPVGYPTDKTRCDSCPLPAAPEEKKP